jgi:hypothetical protein
MEKHKSLKFKIKLFIFYFFLKVFFYIKKKYDVKKKMILKIYKNKYIYIH